MFEMGSDRMVDKVADKVRFFATQSEIAADKVPLVESRQLPGGDGASRR